MGAKGRARALVEGVRARRGRARTEADRRAEGGGEGVGRGATGEGGRSARGDGRWAKGGVGRKRQRAKCEGVMEGLCPRARVLVPGPTRRTFSFPARRSHSPRAVLIPRAPFSFPARRSCTRHRPAPFVHPAPSRPVRASLSPRARLSQRRGRVPAKRARHLSLPARVTCPSPPSLLPPPTSPYQPSSPTPYLSSPSSPASPP
ncbi:hypothetical protein BD626DRAFT_484961 [Schizophyllum amplum]|uniref:Uncharacterized protein n=1 Tax=Schizophyllum amplum TaxID=97359 RepID=A0A550CQW5_9AGAR|nr:hypothetical protein BD626DRAFT_484961 [Auriculariopsis ampla]